MDTGSNSEKHKSEWKLQVFNVQKLFQTRPDQVSQQRSKVKCVEPSTTQNIISSSHPNSTNPSKHSILYSEHQKIKQ